VELTFEILGTPLAKQSMKFTKGGVRYQPKQVTQNAENIKSQVISQLPESFKIIANPVVVDAIFIFPPLKSFNKKMKQHIDNGGYIIKSTKPDLDNLEKAINDALEGIVFLNDSQVCKVRKLKYYGNTPQVRIRVTEVTELLINKI